MMRPPLISTDIASLPSLVALLAACGDLDLRLPPLASVDVDVLLLQGGNRSLGDVVAEGVLRRRLDHLELLRDVDRSVVRPAVHDADALLVRPAEGVHLVHLPRLVTPRPPRPVAEHEVHAHAAAPARSRARWSRMRASGPGRRASPWTTRSGTSSPAPGSSCS